MGYNKSDILKLIKEIETNGKDQYSVALGAMLLVKNTESLEMDDAIEIAMRIKQLQCRCKAMLTYEECICTVINMMNRVDVDYVRSMSDDELVGAMDGCGIDDLQVIVDNYYGE